MDSANTFKGLLPNLKETYSDKNKKKERFVRLKAKLSKNSKSLKASLPKKP